MSTCPGKDIATLSKVADRVRRHIWKDNFGQYLKKIQMSLLIKRHIYVPSCNFYQSMENLTSTILHQTQKNISEVVQDESVSKDPQTPFFGSTCIPKILTHKL